ASAAKDGSSAASSAAASRSSRACTRSRCTPITGPSSANRLATRRAAAASSCSDGSANCCSRPEDSTSTSSIAEGPLVPAIASPLARVSTRPSSRRAGGPVKKRHRRPSCADAQARASVGTLLVLVLLPLAVAGLEAGDAAAGVEDLLLAGVERVAVRADLDGDATVFLGRVCLERVPATAQLGRLHVCRVDLSFHCVLSSWSQGRSSL